MYRSRTSCRFRTPRRSLAPSTLATPSRPSAPRTPSSSSRLVLRRGSLHSRLRASARSTSRRRRTLDLVRGLRCWPPSGSPRDSCPERVLTGGSVGRVRRASAVGLGGDRQVRAPRPRLGADRRLGRPRRQVQGVVRLDHHPPRRRPRRCDRRQSRRRRLGLRRELAPGRPDGQGHRPESVRRGRHLGRDPAPGWYEGLEDDRGHQQGASSFARACAIVWTVPARFGWLWWTARVDRVELTHLPCSAAQDADAPIFQVADVGLVAGAPFFRRRYCRVVAARGASSGSPGHAEG